MSKLFLSISAGWGLSSSYLRLANNLGVSHTYRDAISILFRLHLSQLEGHGIGWSNLECTVHLKIYW